MKRVLLVEDSEADALIFRRFVRPNVELEHAFDGDEALAMLDDASPYDLMIMDLNMPGRNGFQLLEDVRAQAQHHMLPIVVLTTSDAPKDVQRAYELGCNAYLRKASSLQDVERRLKLMQDFWLTEASLPTSN